MPAGQGQDGETELAREKELEHKLMTLRELDERFDLPLSIVRIQALLKERKIEGELRKEGSGLGRYYTSLGAIREYKENLPTPQEFGRKGWLKRFGETP